MKPITFACQETFLLSPHAIVQRILELENWRDFAGYGPLPGIAAVEFEVRTDNIVGTRLLVKNTDGSSHVEEIVEWLPDRRLMMLMHEFTPPVSRLASHFKEIWEFEPQGDSTKVVRRLELYPKHFWSWPLLGLISIVLKKAIARHLRRMRDDAAHTRSS